jgi:hypothetical protein
MHLFHYCSAATAFSVLKTRTIRLSPLSSANDSLEGRLLGLTFRDLLRATQFPKKVQDLANFFVQSLPDSTEGFAFCLSEEGDLLSQWRAYGDNGAGFSLGFESDVLCSDFGEVNFGSQFYELKQVRYGMEGLRELLEPVIEGIEQRFIPYGEFAELKGGISVDEALQIFSKRSESGQFLTSDTLEGFSLILELRDILSNALHFKIYETKPSSFHEEKEWRLLRYRHVSTHPEVSYASAGNSIRPFIECLIADPAKDALASVTLGPRNTSEPAWVSAFLQSCGLGHVVVNRSSATSYRI